MYTMLALLAHTPNHLCTPGFLVPETPHVLVAISWFQLSAKVGKVVTIIKLQASTDLSNRRTTVLMSGLGQSQGSRVQAGRWDGRCAPVLVEG